ncbi:MAG TPA: hypothetical protein QF753_00565 [Victivallales bacterium]|nr:hypothetical protein [Victivallales bacterium]
MGDMFDSGGKLNIPEDAAGSIPSVKIDNITKEHIIKRAYCPKGHSLISNIKIEGEKGIHLLLSDKNAINETYIVLSPVIGINDSIILIGKPFNNGEIIKASCPICRTELDILHNCPCDAPIYIMYLDKCFDKNFAQTFCSRVGCCKSSALTLSEEAMSSFYEKYDL